MAENEFHFDIPTSSNYATDITKNSTIVEEGPRICPLCSSIVRLFYINFYSKIFMCTNTECVYPFAENFTVYSSDDDGLYAGEQFSRKPRKRSSRSNRSARSMGQRSTCPSSIDTNSNWSGSDWSEMSQMSQAYDSDDNVSMTSFQIFTSTLSQKQVQKIEKEQLLKQNVETIKECNQALLDDTEGDCTTIWNEKWIKNLSAMRSSSGMKLVKNHELYKLEKTQNSILSSSQKDVKVDIDSKEDTMSSIIIEIDNDTQDSNEQIMET